MSISIELYHQKFDLTGQIFGRLTVIRKELPPEYVKDKRTSYWLCRCQCGNEIVVKRNSLTSGRTKSCGCLKRDLNRQTKKQNIRIDHGSYIEGIDVQGRSFYISPQDSYIFDMAYWSVRTNGYVCCGNSNGPTLHRLIMHAHTGEIVDHENHNPSDNRRENLRITNTQNNTRNKTLPRNNRSGIIGVCQEKSGCWRAYITVDDYNMKLYSGKSKEAAIRKRLEAENLYFGEFAPQKALFKQYGIEVQNDRQISSISKGVGVSQEP